MDDERQRAARTAHELRTAVAPLTRRLIAQKTLPLGQITVLGWLSRQGPRTTSQLAVLERVRPQSMAQTVKDLEGAGYLAREPDDADRRKVWLRLTPAGAEVVEREALSGQDWLVTTIADRLTPAEQAVLVAAAALIRRIVTD